MRRILLFLGIVSLVVTPLTLGASPESEILIARGIALIKKNDPLAAMVLNQAVASDPQNPAPYFYLGYFYEREGDVLNALSSFKAAIDLDKEGKFYTAYYELGKLSLWLGDFRGAVEYFRKYFNYIANDPFGEFYFAIAKIYSSDMVAESSFNRAATILPELRDVANFYIALNYIHLGQEDKALSWLKKTLAITDDPEIKVVVKKFIYYLENKGKNYKRWGLNFVAGGGVDSDPLHADEVNWSPFSFVDTSAFFLSSPKKSQFGLYQRIFSMYYFQSDYEDARRWHSETSLTYFHTWVKSRLGVELAFYYDSAGVGNGEKFLVNLFGDYNRSILGIFRYGVKGFSLDTGDLGGTSVGGEIYIQSLFIFDGGRSNGYLGVNYTYSDGSYFSEVGPAVEFMVNKNLVGGLYTGIWSKLSAYNYPDFVDDRSDTRVEGRFSLYYQWLNSLRAGLIYSQDYFVSTIGRYNDRWYGLWLGGVF